MTPLKTGALAKPKMLPIELTLMKLEVKRRDGGGKLKKVRKDDGGKSKDLVTAVGGQMSKAGRRKEMRKLRWGLPRRQQTKTAPCLRGPHNHESGRLEVGALRERKKRTR